MSKPSQPLLNQSSYSIPPGSIKPAISYSRASEVGLAYSLFALSSFSYPQQRLAFS